MAKESKTKNYTYDFDGNIVLVQKVKTDKFPPHSYAMKFFIFIWKKI